MTFCSHHGRNRSAVTRTCRWAMPVSLTHTMGQIDALELCGTTLDKRVGCRGLAPLGTSKLWSSRPHIDNSHMETIEVVDCHAHSSVPMSHSPNRSHHATSLPSISYFLPRAEQRFHMLPELLRVTPLWCRWFWVLPTSRASSGYSSRD